MGTAQWLGVLSWLVVLLHFGFSSWSNRGCAPQLLCAFSELWLCCSVVRAGRFFLRSEEIVNGEMTMPDEDINTGQRNLSW